MADIAFSDFLETISSSDRYFAADINTLLLQHNCRCEIKTAAQGYTVSYLLTSTNKTIATFVCRKAGVKLRIYPKNLNCYGDFLNTLPDKMKKEIKKASPCKRLINPDDCNPKCIMGYDFLMDGEHYQKCRYMAFMPTLSAENNPFINIFLEKELQ